MLEYNWWEFDKNVTTPSQDAPTHFTPTGDADITLPALEVGPLQQVINDDRYANYLLQYARYP